MRKITKLLLTAMLLVAGVGTVNADIKIHLNDLKAANGTDEAWLAAIPASYPLNVLDNVLFGSDANTQVTNANVNEYDYLFFKITDFVSERAVRVFFWDPTADKRIDYYLKPIADKETANYGANSTVTANGTYCVKIPVGARLQGAKTTWTASPAADPYFAIEEIYLIERAETYIEASEIIEAPAGTKDAKLLTGTESSWQRTDYPAVLGDNTILFGNGDGGVESTHQTITGYDYLNFAVTSVSAGADFVLRIWVWDGTKVVTLYPHLVSEAADIKDWTVLNKISSTGDYTVNVSDYDYLKGVKSLAYWQGSAGTITVKDAFMSTDAPAVYLPTGKYSLMGDIVGSSSLTAALADANATFYDATGVTGTGVDLTGAANPNALFKADAGVLANTQNVITSGTCANLVLTDNYPFQAPSNFTATAASYSTTINTTAQCGTLCLPFAAAIPDGVTAYTLNYVSGNDAATLTPVETTIPANTPVLLSGSGAAPFTGSGAVDADASKVSGALTGVFANTVVPLNSYVLQNGASGIGFYKVASDITAKPFRAYLTGEFAGSKDFLSFNFDKPTAISQVQGLKPPLGGKDNYTIKTERIMKKKYISPATSIMAVQAQQHMLVGSRVFDDQNADSGLDVLTTEKGDWDIWGGSSDDYDDEY